MSVTVTDNARITAFRHALADQELVHSQPSEEEAQAAPPPNPAQTPTNVSTSNPPGWQDQWRRVPEYRPARNQVDEQRNTYQNEIERNFVRVMFGGVTMMSRASHWWRATGGKLNDTYFKFKIGGEW